MSEGLDRVVAHRNRSKRLLEPDVKISTVWKCPSCDERDYEFVIDFQNALGRL